MEGHLHALAFSDDIIDARGAGGVPSPHGRLIPFQQLDKRSGGSLQRRIVARTSTEDVLEAGQVSADQILQRSPSLKGPATYVGDRLVMHFRQAHLA